MRRKKEWREKIEPKSGVVTALKIMQNIPIQMKYRHKKVLSFNFNSDYIDTVFNIAYAYINKIPAQTSSTSSSINGVGDRRNEIILQQQQC